MTTEHIAPTRFDDRTAAGTFLAVGLATYAQDPNALVLGLLRGGVPVAAEVATRLGLQFDALAVRRLVMPERTEIAFAAIAAYGEHTSLKYVEGVWDSAQLRFEKAVLDQVETTARQELEELRARLVGQSVLQVAERTVILVDDGMASGATMCAAIELMREAGAGRIVVAVPVAPKEALKEVTPLVDELLCAISPRVFHSVSAFYSRFDSLADYELTALIPRR
ncbi:phosphoribosyltransferase [Paeniglutamicibacter terrestris]|uniref:Phosphoribosyltransferase n=1 Tax=Paeniglutamicibacter terrestris TaxID=2723403 RepID=A0ABX1G4M4_9MICC|nr:phosphoribosyltransferase family protein [Paeniglutamicibacter terrestris]ASN39718.1 phosphoribosyl transferase [Arthrobacter sp. 7749]NKG20525.1 phosphoribosyltransferase [Paeniglutamicibacter terrestris]